MKLILNFKRQLLLVLLFLCSSTMGCYGQEILDFGTLDENNVAHAEYIDFGNLDPGQEHINIHFKINGKRNVNFISQYNSIFDFGTYSLYEIMDDKAYKYSVLRNEHSSAVKMYLDSGIYILSIEINKSFNKCIEFYILTWMLDANLPLDEPNILPEPTEKTICHDFGTITESWGDRTTFQIPDTVSTWQSINVYFTVSDRLQATYHFMGTSLPQYTYYLCKILDNKKYCYPAIPNRSFRSDSDPVPTSYLDSGQYVLKIKVETASVTPNNKYFEFGIITHTLEPGLSIDEPTTVSAPAFIPPACLQPGSEPTYESGPVPGLSISRSYLLSRQMLSAEGTSKLESISYTDGLGRPLQTVLRGITPSGADLADFTDYDDYGHIWRKWKHVPMKGLNGAFVNNLPLKSGSLCGDKRPYTELRYVASHSDTPTLSVAPGSLWSQHPTSEEHITNTQMGLTNCLNFSISSNNQLAKGRFWMSKELSVVRSSDEDNNCVLTFTDKLGRILLERTLHDTTSYDTYYVYDKRGDLRYVLPPALDGNVSDSLLNLYAYSYSYDNLHRMVEKKLPNCATQRFVYDTADRLIFSQDGRQASKNEWVFCLPDTYGREVVQGTCIQASTPALTTRVKASFSLAESSIPGTGYTVTGTSLTSPSLLTVNYYDTYEFLSLPGIAAYADSLAYKPVLQYDTRYTNSKAPASSAYGRLTGCRTYIPGSSQEIVTAFYYDAQENVVQSRSSNHLGGYNVDCFVYTFTGKVKRNRHTHTAKDKPRYTETYGYSYDHADRLSTVSYRLNNNPEVELLQHTYDEFCRLSTTSFCNGVDSLKYAYNIRDWMSEISTASGVFKQIIHYNDGLGIPQYNGNISSMTWQSGNNALSKGYKFSYDASSRLKNAIYGEGEKLLSNPNRFNEQVLEYDKMGNILGLLRYSQTSQVDCGLIDNLNLVYNGNQLQSVRDNATHSVYGNGMEFKDSANQSVEYYYDLNGNLTKDLNKKITDIQYNLLNLPSQITFEDGNRVEYVYDASGTKLRTVHYLGGDTLTTDYCGNAIYEDGELKMLLNETGYYSFQDSKHHFYLKDHLGNIRVVVDENGNVEETNDYYPFGGLTSNSSANVQPYKYNGKELDRKGGLDLYDYGARQYDVAIGRWHAVDPMSEKYYSISPYVYCANNPIKYVDPNGKWIVGTDGKLVTYNVQTGWSKNVSKSMQRIGDSLLKTETGTKQLNSMISSEDKISITISSEIKKEGNKLTLGINSRKDIKTTKDGKIKVGEHKMTIYEGSIKEVIKEGSGVKGYSGLGLEDAIGVVAGHESGHTEKENTKQALENNDNDAKHDVEKHPNEIESKILEELKKKK